mmetsp:Transcript_7843/g.21928  ORF Transcript_7843/g.21928 Transcript_7843/m.21928 type:complete len:155 (-) Transcript_7843:422-886(-)|eukprot:scaffold118715_cov31-Tisochrysis_lutea.AAC.1
MIVGCSCAAKPRAFFCSPPRRASNAHSTISNAMDRPNPVMGTFSRLSAETEFTAASFTCMPRALSFLSPLKSIRISSPFVVYDPMRASAVRPSHLADPPKGACSSCLQCATLACTRVEVASQALSGTQAVGMMTPNFVALLIIFGEEPRFEPRF